MRWPSLPTSAALATLALIPTAASARTLIDVGFEGMKTGEPLPAGGAVARAPGETRDGAITTAIERYDGSNWLAIGDNDDYAAGAVRFEPPGAAIPRHGELAISADLYFDPVAPGDGFFVYVREARSAAKTFLNLYFSPDGAISWADEAHPAYQPLGTWADRTGRALPLDVVFDLDEGTYDVWLDDAQVIAGARHGISGEVPAAVLFGTEHDEDLEGVFYVDNVLMTHEDRRR